MFLGQAGVLKDWAEDKSAATLVVRMNVLERWVDLPSDLRDLRYSNLLAGAVRGALEVVCEELCVMCATHARTHAVATQHLNTALANTGKVQVSSRMDQRCSARRHRDCDACDAAGRSAAGHWRRLRRGLSTMHAHTLSYTRCLMPAAGCSLACHTMENSALGIETRLPYLGAGCWAKPFFSLSVRRRTYSTMTPDSTSHITSTVCTIARAIHHGFSYGTRLRLPHAIVMGAIFRKQAALSDILQSGCKSAWHHGSKLAMYVACYHAVRAVLPAIMPAQATGLPVPDDVLHAGIAGGIAGYLVWARAGYDGISYQIALYLAARVVIASLRIGARAELPLLRSVPFKDAGYRLLVTGVWAAVMAIFQHQEWRPMLPSSLTAAMTYLYSFADEPTSVSQTLASMDVFVAPLLVAAWKAGTSLDIDWESARAALRKLPPAQFVAWVSAFHASLL